MNNILVLKDTLSCFEKGYYVKNGQRVAIPFAKDELMETRVYLPDDISVLKIDASKASSSRTINVNTVNCDSFVCARDYEQWEGKNESSDHSVLVLNFANAFNPGGGVRIGAQAQEEELCRVSSLLTTLEGESAKSYYRYHHQLGTNMASDAVIITPNVAVIKDGQKDYLDKPVLVSVMTSAAPNLMNGLEGLSEDKYISLFYSRIYSLMKVAAYEGYRNLVLGAFGCGVFENKPAFVSGLFKEILDNADFDGFKANQLFDNIQFAVLDRSRSQDNYKCFKNLF